MLFCIPLIGCLNGDFGRVRQSLVTDDIHAWVGRAAVAPYGIPPSLFRLTDEERLLRDLAYPLIEPPFQRQRWYSVLNEYGLFRVFRSEWYVFDPTQYAAILVTRPTRSTSALYGRLIEDIRNDIVRIGPFADIARRVIDLDDKREKSLAYVSILSEAELVDARARMAENKLIVGWAHRSLVDRAAAYHFALERLVISAPSPMAAETERQWVLLKTTIPQVRLVPAPPIATAVISK